MSSSEIIKTSFNNAYIIGSAFLLESILQWWIIIYFVTPEFIWEHFNVCKLQLLIAYSVIVVYRYADCQCLAQWLRIVVALVTVELIICGGSFVFTTVSGNSIVFTSLLIAVLFVLVSFVGCYMASSDNVLCVGFLCFWSFIVLMVLVLVVTLLLSLDWQLGITNVFVMCSYPALFFCVAYDARRISALEMKFENNLRFGLYLYALYDAMLGISLLLFGS